MYGISFDAIVQHKKTCGNYSIKFSTPNQCRSPKDLELRPVIFPPHLFEAKAVRIDDVNADHSQSIKTPNFEAIELITDTKLPRYIYRVSFDGSGGSSKLGDFKSESMTIHLGKTDFASIPYEMVSRDLQNHLHGNRGPERNPFHSPWISFTDSWMFARYWALRHKTKRRRNVKIHIVDTHTIKTPVLIVHSFSMVKAYNVGSHLPLFLRKKMLGGTYTEFLVWNELLASSADEIDHEELLKAEVDIYGNSIPYPSLVRMLDPQRISEDDGTEVVDINHPATIRGLWYEDEAEKYWRTSQAWQGVGTYKTLRHRSYAGRMKAARPPKECKVADKRVGMDALNFGNLKAIAFCARPEFRLDILIAELSLRSKVYYFDSIVKQLTTDEDVHNMRQYHDYYATCQVSYKKKEVQKHQELWIKCAKALGIPIFTGPDRPRRNLVQMRFSEKLRRPILRYEEDTKASCPQAMDRVATLNPEPQSTADLSEQLYDTDERKIKRRKYNHNTVAA